MQTDLFDPIDPGDDDPDNERGGDRDNEDEDPMRQGRCASCGDTIALLGPTVCPCCQRRGYCPICGLLHGGAQMCPEVRVVWAEEDAKEAATQRQIVRDAVAAILEANPIWQEAA